jgi:DNA topoisomerase-1
LAVLGRRFVDAWLGFAGTREITRAARQVASVKVLSVGRVQLPTLYLIVSADLAHETFVPTDQWALAAKLKHKGTEFDIIHISGYVTDEKLVHDLLNQLSTAKHATVKQVKTEIETQLPPHPLNTTSAVSLLSKTMKIQASKALELMVDLYNRGLLSYPRTENKKFKAGFPHKDIISSLLKISDYVPYISQIQDTTQVRNNGPRKGEEEDHDPIHPTGELKGIGSLPNPQAKALDILTRHYISLFLPDLKIEKTQAGFGIEGEEFGARGRRVVDLGWRAICWWITTKENELPELISGETIAILELYLKSNQTKPPKRYTDAELLLAMERANIGTKSSRPDILKKIQQRNYVRRQGQTLISTLWGRTLIASLTPIWPEIVSPEFTAYVEELMDKVAKGSETFPAMFTQLRQKYMQLHQKLIEKIPEYQDLLKEVKLSDQKERGLDQIHEINAMLLQLKI